MTVLWPLESPVEVVWSVRQLKLVGSWGSHLVSPGRVMQLLVVPERREFPALGLVVSLGCSPVCGVSRPRLTPASPTRTTGGCG